MYVGDSHFKVQNSHLKFINRLKYLKYVFVYWLYHTKMQRLTRAKKATKRCGKSIGIAEF